MRSRALVASLTAAFALVAGPALAQSPPSGKTVPSLDLRGFRAPLDPASGVHLEPADSPGSWEWSFGFWTQYAFRPITLRDGKTNSIAADVLKHQVTSDLTVMVGIGHRFAFGVDLPVLLYQTGDAPTVSSAQTLGTLTTPSQAFGDLGLSAKVTLVRPTLGAQGGFALALHERLTLPTGDPASFLGEAGVTGTTRLMAEYRLVSASIHADAGVKLRARPEDFACGGVATESACSSRFGNEIPWGLGLAFRPQALGIDKQDRWTWFLESYGYLPAGPIAPGGSHAASSVRLSLGARFALKNVSFLAGVESGVLGGVGDAPVRALLSVAYAPRFHDRDGDGIEDDKDQCPDLPEDFDGFQDDDGCPDTDNDDDGVPDKLDKCPTQKEDEDGFQDDDGCPDPDNDNDGILDDNDACPNQAGPPNADPKKNGCPAPAATTATPAPASPAPAAPAPTAPPAPAPTAPAAPAAPSTVPAKPAPATPSAPAAKPQGSR